MFYEIVAAWIGAMLIWFFVGMIGMLLVCPFLCRTRNMTREQRRQRDKILRIADECPRTVEEALK